MSTVAPPEMVAAPAARSAVPAWLSINHAATIFVSAFLLFEVQPLISKFILPWFGGSPAVWTTCMLFFQILLFLGYAYAHWATNRLTPQSQAILHLSLLVIALTRLPITPSADWKPTDGSDPTWRILMLLAATVGVPYFVLSTTGPLVQAWFSRAFAGRSPYRLYSLSNIGSLLALVTYPFVIEPAWDVVVQSRAWSGLFALFAGLCGLAAAWNWRLGHVSRLSPAQNNAASTKSATAYPPLTILRRLLWLTLPACASLMLLATTNHVCQDIAVVPFLWVLPLALYLLTFIISFDHERWYQPLLFGVATLLLTLAVAGWRDFDTLVERVSGHELNFVEEIAVLFMLMFLVCMTCHGELVRLRPDPAHLTEFYLMISAGGALGGVFVSLIAPHIFSTFFEWQIALVASLVVAVVVTFRNLKFAVSSISARSVAGFVAAIVGLYFVVQWQVRLDAPLDRARNFYGVVSVWDAVEDDPRLNHRLLRHGAITHGKQFSDPERRHLPLSYYAEKSGVGRAVKFMQDRSKQVHVGTIGLGVGTIATYARPEDDFVFYEINPEVRRQAETFFTFLKDCKGKLDIKMGDARLTLERSKPEQFDVLVVDAFSGDAIPAHLATQEAFEIYRKHVKPDGILAIHITNKYLDLFPVIRGLAEHNRWKWTRIYTPYEPESMLNRADWMLLTNNQEFLDGQPIEVPKDVEAAPTREVALWTDHFSNLFEVLKVKW